MGSDKFLGTGFHHLLQAMKAKGHESLGTRLSERLALVCYIKNNTHLACYYGNKGEVENIGYLYLTQPSYGG